MKIKTLSLIFLLTCFVPNMNTFGFDFILQSREQSTAANQTGKNNPTPQSDNESLTVILNADSVWYDLDFDGQEFDTLDASGSIAIGTTIESFQWYINEELILANTGEIMVSLPTGTNRIKVIVITVSGIKDSATTEVDVYCARFQTGGEIYDGVSQLGDSYYVTSHDQKIYKIDSLGNKLAESMATASYPSAIAITDYYSSNRRRIMHFTSGNKLYCYDEDLVELDVVDMGGTMHCSPVVSSAEHLVYFGTPDNKLICNRFTESGYETVWSYVTDSPIGSSPVIIEKSPGIRNIYFGTGSGNPPLFYILQDSCGVPSEVAKIPVANRISSSLAVYNKDDELFIYALTYYGHLYRFNEDGSQHTGLLTNNVENEIHSLVIGKDDLVYFSSGMGLLTGFPYNFTSSSTYLKYFDPDFYMYWGTPAIGNDGKIYTGDVLGRFYALRDEPGNPELQKEWYLDLHDQISGSNLVTNTGLIFCSCDDGCIYIMKDPDYARKDFQQNSLDLQWPTLKGNNKRNKCVNLYSSTTSLSVNNETSYSLIQNYPNPFNPETTIPFALPSKSHVTLTIYNALGEKVSDLVNRNMDSGYHEVSFYASQFSSGTYIYELRAGNFRDVKKMLLIK